MSATWYCSRCNDSHLTSCPLPPDEARELALAFRQYQAALNDPAYWEPDGRERNKQQVGEAFDRLVQLTNTILGDR